jgi:hypothetical protein
MKLGEVYTQGSFSELKKLLMLKENPKILYIGKENTFKVVYQMILYLFAHR